MGTEIICLVLVIILLAIADLSMAVCMCRQNKAFRSERTDYINRILAKNNNEYIHLKRSTESEGSVADKEMMDFIGNSDRNNFYNGIIN